MVIWSFNTVWSLLGMLHHVTSSQVVVRRLPGLAAEDTISAIARELHTVTSSQDVLYNMSTSIDKSFDDLKLFHYTSEITTQKGQQHASSASGVDITCTRCYIKGHASAKLSKTGSFNLNQTLQNTKDMFTTTIDNLTDYAVNMVKEFGELKITHLDEFNISAPEIDLNLNVPQLPDCHLHLALGDVDVYVALDVALSSGLTYRFNLYSSTEFGIELSEKLFFGMVISVDLILSVESEIVMSSGFHIRFDNDISMDISMFSKLMSDLAFDGGEFEFLPVTVQSAGTSLQAVLRLQLRAGFSFDLISTGLDAEILGFGFDSPGSVGIETRMYANVAEFTTNVTAVPEDGDGKGCSLQVHQGYKFAVGAAAGASLAVLDHTWGPTPETEIPIFYTTFSTGCAESAKPTSTMTSIAARSEAVTLVATTITEKVTYLAVDCASPGLINCPATLEKTSKHVTTTTKVTSVPDGSKATWPASNTAATPVMFGTEAMSMTGSRGKPKSYLPTTASTSRPGASLAAEKSHDKNHSQRDSLIIGLTVGIGVPVLLAMIAGVFIWRMRQSRQSFAAYHAAPSATVWPEDGSLTSPEQIKATTAIRRKPL